MGNLLAKGARWLAQQQSRHAASDVEYRRGASVAVVRAVRGKTGATNQETGNGSLDASIDDFLIEVACLVLGGDLIEPEQGDRIVVDGVTFEVQPPPGATCWRYDTEYRARYRIHVRQVAA